MMMTLYADEARDQARDDWDRDLNPDGFAGRHAGPADAQAAKNAPPARDLKAVHNALHWLTDEALGRIPILPAGTRLLQGATYVDLRSPDRHEFTATADMAAGPDNWYVPKSEVDYQLWNRLLGKPAD
jgi:hypothetical protein